MKRAKHLVSAIILFLYVAVCWCPVALASTPTTPADLNLTITAPDSSIALGSTIKLTVTAENKSASYSLDYLKFNLKYDRGLLNYSDGSAESDTAHTGLMVVDDASGLIVRYISDGSNTKKALAPGEKMELTFTFTPAVTSTTPVTVTFDEIQTYARTDISNSSIGEDNIKHTFTVSEPYSSIAMNFRTKSGNANLSALSVKVDNTEKTLSPVFSANVTAYTLTVDEPVGAVTITCTCQDSGATYKQTQAGSVYTITVTAEDGTTKAYTITLNAVPTTTTTTTTTTAAPTTTTTAAPTTTVNTDVTQPTDSGMVSDSNVPGSETDSDNKSGGLLTTVNISVLGLIGIVAGEIGLFMLAFLSGYMTHKNASKPPKISLEDLVAAHAQAEMEGYEDNLEQAAMENEQGMMPEMTTEPFIPQFSAQVSFPTDGMGTPDMNGMGMPGGYDMGTPDMNGTGMPGGYDMGAPDMNGMGMPGGYDMGAPDMNGMGILGGYDMGAPDMNGMGIPGGYDMGAPDMNGMGIPGGYDMGTPDMNGMGIPGGYNMGAPDMNGMGMPPGYGM